jgi:hypothetical protein
VLLFNPFLPPVFSPRDILTSLQRGGPWKTG